MLTSCILIPLKTTAVLQYYCLRQVYEPEIEVPHRGLAFTLTLKVFALSWPKSYLHLSCKIPSLLLSPPESLSIPLQATVPLCHMAMQSHVAGPPALSPEPLPSRYLARSPKLFWWWPPCPAQVHGFMKAALPSPSLLPLPNNKPPVGERTKICSHFAPILHNE